MSRRVNNKRPRNVRRRAASHPRKLQSASVPFRHLRQRAPAKDQASIIEQLKRVLV